jgi:hypothetical protein
MHRGRTSDQAAWMSTDVGKFAVQLHSNANVDFVSQSHTALELVFHTFETKHNVMMLSPVTTAVRADCKSEGNPLHLGFHTETQEALESPLKLSFEPKGSWHYESL